MKNEHKKSIRTSRQGCFTMQSITKEEVEATEPKKLSFICYCGKNAAVKLQNRNRSQHTIYVLWQTRNFFVCSFSFGYWRFCRAASSIMSAEIVKLDENLRLSRTLYFKAGAKCGIDLKRVGIICFSVMPRPCIIHS